MAIVLYLQTSHHDSPDAPDMGLGDSNTETDWYRSVEAHRLWVCNLGGLSPQNSRIK